MADILYRTWSLLPRDLDPSTQEPTLRNPPLIPNLALDAGASLQFDLEGPVSGLTMHITATALSAEGRDDGFLEVLSGTSGALRPAPVRWSRRQDGGAMVFEAHLGAAGPCVKVHLPAGPTLVVTAVAFEA